MPEGWTPPDPVGDLMAGMGENGLPTEPVDPTLGVPYSDQPQTPGYTQPGPAAQPLPEGKTALPPNVRRPPQPQPRDTPDQQPEGRQPAERRAEALFF
ncbi:hypothetical protein LTR94_025742 [Friedmanniomyces endolithicus]|nr:hypothetical protein LTR94_025742 [Friedmanniomyces endolithicus]